MTKAPSIICHFAECAEINLKGNGEESAESKVRQRKQKRGRRREGSERKEY
jgi:hypothetical protein